MIRWILAEAEAMMGIQLSGKTEEEKGEERGGKH